MSKGVFYLFKIFYKISDSSIKMDIPIWEKKRMKTPGLAVSAFYGIMSQVGNNGMLFLALKQRRER
jgi:hypothetical protein